MTRNLGQSQDEGRRLGMVQGVGRRDDVIAPPERNPDLGGGFLVLKDEPVTIHVDPATGGFTVVNEGGKIHQQQTIVMIHGRDDYLSPCENFGTIWVVERHLVGGGLMLAQEVWCSVCQTSPEILAWHQGTIEDLLDPDADGITSKDGIPIDLTGAVVVRL